jgi:hypothetical protein
MKAQETKRNEEDTKLVNFNARSFRRECDAGIPRMRADAGIPRMRADAGIPRMRAEAGIPRMRAGDARSMC